MKMSIPQPILDISNILVDKGFKAYLVGGCVRDLILEREPKDWDVATDAYPDKIQEIFPDSVYENSFGTVAVKTGSDDLRFKIVEVTTFRKDGGYTDRRHPDKVVFSNSIEEDLARRDFTINAMALDIKSSEKIIDPFEGQDDIENKLIRTVGDSRERFSEDALRIMRAVRFSTELNFSIEKSTKEKIFECADFISEISNERIRDEFVKIIMSDRAMFGVQELEDLGLLKNIIPELREGIGCGQNKHHIYTVWEHNLRALDYAVSKKYSLHIRLASLMHDIGKPATKRGEGINSTFYSHEIIGGKMVRVIMDRLKFSRHIADKVVHLVRQHLFYYNVDEVSASGVRRFLSRVGEENVDDLIKVREADRIGSGVPKAVPYKLRHLLFMIDKVRRDPISSKMLELKGDDVMRILNISASPRVGLILLALMDEVLENPEKNTKKYLENYVCVLGEMSDDDLRMRANAGKSRVKEEESGFVQAMKKRHRVE
jgi:tRNA nucleotidyltransferase (CCA-adding enzyme)